MTKARQVTAALPVAVAMTVGAQASAQDAAVVVTDPSERTIDLRAIHLRNFDTSQASTIRTSWGASAQSAPPAGRQRMNRVRSDDPAIAALITQASQRSTTFGELVETVNATDGIVYVNEGMCGRGARACFKHQLIMAGPNRVLHILVDPHRPDWDLMGALGHELRHAIEVLSDRGITSDAAMRSFYKQNGVELNGVLETRAAIAAGADVRREIRQALREDR